MSQPAELTSSDAEGVPLRRDPLGAAGHTVAERRNGAEALTRLTEISLDLLNMGIYLPVMDGLELITELCAERPR